MSGRKTINFDTALYRELLEKARIESGAISRGTEMLCERVIGIIKDRFGVRVEDVDFLHLPLPEWDQYVNRTDKRSSAKNFVIFLFSTRPFPYELFPKNFLLRMLFVKRDVEFQDFLLEELSSFAEALFTFMQSRSTSMKSHFIMVLGRIYSIIPFLEPESGREIVLPQQVEDASQKSAIRLMRFRVERLEITPAFLGTPLTAYCFEPDDTSAEPLLVFMGTPPPSTNCAFLASLVDLTPFFGVGEIAFDLFAKRRISRWLENRSSGVKVYGQSLGGSLALMTFLYNQEKISEVHAYSPAALSKRKLRKSRVDTAKKVSIYIEENDPVPYVGAGWGSGWNIFYGITKEHTHFFLAHLRPLPILDPVAVWRISSVNQFKKGIWKRFVMNTLHFVGSLLFFLPLLVLQAVRCFRQSRSG